MSEFRIETPHAAVVIWNYVDRLGLDPSNKGTINKTEDYKIINSMSCVSIETSKSKSQPQGSFRLVLAPYRNWVSTLTVGSWCCIHMSNEKITKEDLTSSKSKNKKNTLKMIGRIESVRVDTQVGEDGARRTLYYVSGVDWGYIFNNVLYIDPSVAASKDQGTQGNAMFVALRKLIYTEQGEKLRLAPDEVLASLMNIFSTDVSFNAPAASVGRLGKTVYDFKMPEAMAKYLGLKTSSVGAMVSIKTGVLSSYNKYEKKIEALTLPNSLLLQGQHTLWQIMLENSNPPLNEMLCDLDWESGNDAPKLNLYKRIKPFSFKGGASSGNASKLRSYFNNVKRHTIDSAKVLSLNVGTNWRDKFNFVEIKFDSQEFSILDNTTKKISQYWDEVAFNREGFRPIIETTRQLPIKPTEDASKVSKIDWDWSLVADWVSLLKEWYFDTHRMLNGTINMVGTTEYISVGNNIKFELNLINPTTNMTSKTLNSNKKFYVLAHVENVSHRFSVNPDSGARSYTTTVQFSRGIIVDKDNVKVGEGTLDSSATKVSMPQDANTKNVAWNSDKQDPG